jgi:Predicted Zn-dependent proteases and their inactivated homologs
MFKFPEGLYTDVRIEDVYETKIIYTMGEIEESKERTYKAAFIRIFDGEKWYYNSISNIEDIQAEIDLLSQYANPNEHIEENPVVKKFQVNKENLLKFKDGDIKKISIKEKQNLLKEYFPALQEYEFIKHWNAYYVDRKIYKEFYSSKGSSIKFDNQTTGLTIKNEICKRR